MRPVARERAASAPLGLLEIALVTAACAALALVTALDPRWALPVLALAVVLGLALRSPFVSLVLFVLMLFTRPAELWPSLAAFSPVRLAAVAAVVVFAASRLLEGRLGWARTPLTGWVLAFAAGAWISGRLGTSPPSSELFFTDVFAKLLVLYLLILNLVDTPRRAVRLELAIALGVAFIAGYAVWQRATGADLVEGTRAGAIGLLGDPNDLALSLLVALPFLLLATRDARGLARAGLGALLLVTLAGLAVTQSRGGLLGLGVAAFALLRHRVRHRALLAVGVGAAVVAFALLSGVAERTSFDAAGTDASAQGRIDAWLAGLRMFRWDPLTGVGLAQFVPSYFTYVVDPVTWEPRAAHNTFIQVLAETGLAGFVPFTALVVLAWRRAREAEAAPAPPAGLWAAARRSQLARLLAVLTAALFLSQAWGWFVHVAIAAAVANARVVQLQDDAARAGPEAPP